MKTESGKDRVDKAKDRLDAKIAEMVEEMADGPIHPKETTEEVQHTQGEMPGASMDMEDADESMPTAVRSNRGTKEVYIGTSEGQRPRIDKMIRSRGDGRGCQQGSQVQFGY